MRQIKRVVAAICVGGALMGAYAIGATAGEKKADPRVFELRTYTPGPGKMDALLARFRNHTTKLFEKHGIKNIGYWVTADTKLPEQDQKLIYLVAHKSREAAATNWKEFGGDPEWKEVHAESEKDGKLAVKVESVYLNPTDFSPIK